MERERKNNEIEWTNTYFRYAEFIV